MSLILLGVRIYGVEMLLSGMIGEGFEEDVETMLGLYG